MQRQQKGTLFAIGAYIIWGIFPMYWKWLEHVNSMEVLLNRIIWSFIITLVVIVLRGEWSKLKGDWQSVWDDKRQLFSLSAASFVVSINWFTYIWAVQSGHILQTSLGYYMNPLLSIIFGVLFFKESLSRALVASFVIATIGVGYMVWSVGEVPWVALTLACSFAVYGVLKKRVQLDALRGLTIETACMVPVALIGYVVLAQSTPIALFQVDRTTDLLLIGSGIATAVPLIFFAKGAQSMPLYMLGFIQFLAPTISFCIGVFVYGESFTTTHLVTFSCIWFAVALFSYSSYKSGRQQKRRAENV